MCSCVCVCVCVPWGQNVLKIPLQFISSQCTLDVSVISPSHNFFVVKIFKKCESLDFKFHLGKLDNRDFPIWCNVNFESTIQISKENFNITPYGENFY